MLPRMQQLVRFVALLALLQLSLSQSPATAPTSPATPTPPSYHPAQVVRDIPDSWPIISGDTRILSDKHSTYQKRHCWCVHSDCPPSVRICPHASCPCTNTDTTPKPRKLKIRVEAEDVSSYNNSSDSNSNADTIRRKEKTTAEEAPPAYGEWKKGERRERREKYNASSASDEVRTFVDANGETWWTGKGGESGLGSTVAPKKEEKKTEKSADSAKIEKDQIAFGDAEQQQNEKKKKEAGRRKKLNSIPSSWSRFTREQLMHRLLTTNQTVTELQRQIDDLRADEIMSGRANQKLKRELKQGVTGDIREVARSADSVLRTTPLSLATEEQKLDHVKQLVRSDAQAQLSLQRKIEQLQQVAKRRDKLLQDRVAQTTAAVKTAVSAQFSDEVRIRVMSARLDALEAKLAALSAQQNITERKKERKQELFPAGASTSEQTIALQKRVVELQDKLEASMRTGKTAQVKAEVDSRNAQAHLADAKKQLKDAKESAKQAHQKEEKVATEEKKAEIKLAELQKEQVKLKWDVRNTQMKEEMDKNKMHKAEVKLNETASNRSEEAVVKAEAKLQTHQLKEMKVQSKLEQKNLEIDQTKSAISRLHDELESLKGTAKKADNAVSSTQLSVLESQGDVAKKQAQLSQAIESNPNLTPQQASELLVKRELEQLASFSTAMQSARTKAEKNLASEQKHLNKLAQTEHKLEREQSKAQAESATANKLHNNVVALKQEAQEAKALGAKQEAKEVKQQLKEVKADEKTERKKLNSEQQRAEEQLSTVHSELSKVQQSASKVAQSFADLRANQITLSSQISLLNSQINSSSSTSGQTLEIPSALKRQVREQITSAQLDAELALAHGQRAQQRAKEQLNAAAKLDESASKVVHKVENMGRKVNVTLPSAVVTSGEAKASPQQVKVTAAIVQALAAQNTNKEKKSEETKEIAIRREQAANLMDQVKSELKEARDLLSRASAQQKQIQVEADREKGNSKASGSSKHQLKKRLRALASSSEVTDARQALAHSAHRLDAARRDLNLVAEMVSVTGHLLTVQQRAQFAQLTEQIKHTQAKVLETHQALMKLLA